jgi:hypothetical protein
MLEDLISFDIGPYLRHGCLKRDLAEEMLSPFGDTYPKHYERFYEAFMGQVVKTVDVKYSDYFEVGIEGVLQRIHQFKFNDPEFQQQCDELYEIHRDEDVSYLNGFNSQSIGLGFEWSIGHHYLITDDIEPNVTITDEMLEDLKPVKHGSTNPKVYELYMNLYEMVVQRTKKGLQVHEASFESAFRLMIEELKSQLITKGMFNRPKSNIELF